MRSGLQISSSHTFFPFSSTSGLEQKSSSQTSPLGTVMLPAASETADGCPISARQLTVDALPSELALLRWKIDCWIDMRRQAAAGMDAMGFWLAHR